MTRRDGRNVRGANLIFDQQHLRSCSSIWLSKLLAREQAQRLMGEGDGERARIFASAFGRDPEFAAFYRSMAAYEEAIDEGTPIVVPPDSDFFRYMQRRRAG